MKILKVFLVVLVSVVACSVYSNCGFFTNNSDSSTDEGGEGPPVTTPIALGTPLGLMATAGNHQVTLNWGAVDSAAGYNIYFANEPGVTKSIGSAKAAGTLIEGIADLAYAHTGLDNGALYCYVVESTASDGTVGGMSTEVCATPMPGVGTASITPYSMQNTITWDMMPGDVDSWNIYRSVNATPSISVGKAAAFGAGVTSPFVDAGLSNNNVPVCYTLEQVVGGTAVPYSEVCGTPYTVGELEFAAGNEQRTWSWASDVDLAEDGSIIVLGVRQNASGWDDMMMMRFLGDALDTSFGVGGYYYAPINEVSWLGSNYSVGDKIGMAMDADGNILLAVSWLDKKDPKVLGDDMWYPLRRLNGGGALDESFGDKDAPGLAAYTGYTAYMSVFAHDVAIDGSGSLVMSGRHRTNLGVALDVLWRYTDEGILDATFNSSGGLPGMYDSGTPFHDQDFTDVVVDSNGRIVTGGIGNLYDRGDHFFGMIWRHVLVDEGRGNYGVELDRDFGGGLGYVQLLDEDSYIDSIFIDSEGRILFAGASPNADGGVDFVVGRLTADGTLDETFGDGGYARCTAEPRMSDYAADVVVDASGKIVAVGKQNNMAVVHRYLSDGTLDPIFASGGVMTIEGGNGFDAANRLAIDDMGRLVVVGQTQGAMQLGVALWRIE